MPTVTREARFIIGMDSPVHYYMGQIEQESRCNEGAIAFDGGMGLGQLMPETAKDLHSRYRELGEMQFAPLDPRWNIRAMLIYDRECYWAVDCQGWYFAFRAYNGGIGNLNREIRQAGSCEQREVEMSCKGRSIRLKGGRILDLCKVNIEYPKTIFIKAQKYER